jgi:type II secretory pathway pseudopilin PulG
MAISPIDLQTLFSQVDKVGKQENAQKAGLAIQQSMQHMKAQQIAEQKIDSVNEAQDSGDGAEGIKDRSGPRQGPEGENERKEGEEKEAVEKHESTISDPDLGRNIDVSL